jgi:hypothetical protein
MADHVAESVRGMVNHFAVNCVGHSMNDYGVSEGTILAAYHVMVLQDVEPTEQNLVKVLNAFMMYACDETEVVNSEESHFMDLCRKRNLSPGVMDRLVTELADQILADFRSSGCHVIRIRGTRGWRPEDCGFYVFGADVV